MKDLRYLATTARPLIPVTAAMSAAEAAAWLPAVRSPWQQPFDALRRLLDDFFVQRNEFTGIHHEIVSQAIGDFLRGFGGPQPAVMMRLAAASMGQR